MDRHTASASLCDSLNARVDEARAIRLGQLSASDWEHVIRLAARHGVTPLLYQRLKALTPRASIPASTMHALRQVYLASAADSIRLSHRLSEVLTVLQDNNIPVIALKGVHLATVVYDNTALRPMFDVDLLVRRDDLLKVVENLRRLGYKSEHFSIEAVCATHSDLPVFTRPGTAPIEVHWTIENPTSPFEIDIDGLWQRSRPAALAGASMLVLSPEDLLLHLCLHATFHHRFALGLKPFCDIAETLGRYQGEIEWDQLQFRARQWGASKCLYLTLYFAHELLGAAVPGEVLNELESMGLNLELQAWARGQILAGQRNTALLTSNIARVWEANRLQDKVSTFLRFAFPSPQALAAEYPASPASKRIYFYYPLRLRDLLLRYGSTSWRLLRRDKDAIAWAEQEAKGNALVDWFVS